MAQGMTIAVFGPSLVSSYWNNDATYFRGLLRALVARGHRVIFLEPDAHGRQQHRDMPDPPWAEVVVFGGQSAWGVGHALERARTADLVVKASEVGMFDELLEQAVLDLRRPGSLVAFWDLDAPATLARLRELPDDALASLIPRYDLVFTHGGGAPVVRGYERLGARLCVPIDSALDPDTHRPIPPAPRFEADLCFLGNRRPDREARVDEFFLRAAALLPDRRFLLGGSGWEDKALPSSVTALGHVYSADYNALNSTARAVLEVSRSGGLSPPPHVFEAAGAGACVITDPWEGIEQYLEPGLEVLIAEDGESVAELVEGLTPGRARRIGQEALRRALAEHTYAHRARELEAAVSGLRVRPLAQPSELEAH